MPIQEASWISSRDTIEAQAKNPLLRDDVVRLSRVYHPGRVEGRDAVDHYAAPNDLFYPGIRGHLDAPMEETTKIGVNAGIVG